MAKNDKKKCKVCKLEFPEGYNGFVTYNDDLHICEKCIENAHNLLNKGKGKPLDFLDDVFSNTSISFIAPDGKPIALEGDNKNEMLSMIDNLMKGMDATQISHSQHKPQADYTQKVNGLDDKKLFDLLPLDIHTMLDDYVIGHEKTKKVLAVSLFQHINRMKHSVSKSDIDNMLKKSNILLMGESGSGKTLIVETISKILNVPFVVQDATSLTSKGYVGGDVDDMITSLLMKADGNVDLAQRGIIFIDEIDKIASNGENGKDVNGKGVQEGLLKIIDGSKMNVNSTPTPKNMMAVGGNPMVEFDTSNILFIFGGAFDGISKIQDNLNKTNTMGFKTDDNNIQFKSNSINNCLLEYGFSPEFLGRIPVVSQLEKLTRDNLREIIYKPKNSILNQYSTFFESEDVYIELSEDAYDAILDKIENNKVGARALKTIFEDLCLNITYNIENFKHKILTITCDFVESGYIKDLEVVDRLPSESEKKDIKAIEKKEAIV